MLTAKLIRRSFTAFAFTLALLALPGCNGYMLQGKVVRGEASSVQLVMADDGRLDAAGVGNAEVRITRDPESLNRHLVGQARSSPTGDFTIIMNGFGTGWMEEKWQVQGIAPGFGNADTLMEMPSKNSKWRLLITMGPGVSEPPRDDDPAADIEKFK